MKKYITLTHLLCLYIVVEGAVGQVLDIGAPDGPEQQLQQLPEHPEGGDVA